MSALAICRRYAAALHDEAESIGVVDRVDADVAMTRAALDESRDLELMFASPVIRAATKRSIIEKLFADRVSDVFLRFLVLLNDKGRGDMIKDVLSEYRTFRNKQLGIVEAQARSAMGLSGEEIDSLKNRLGEVVNAEVHLEVEPDPSLLGGVVVRVGDTVYDGSLKRRLSALRAQLGGGSFLRN
ncbi:MAG TPA: ATP synthase F1 subunit delta [Rhodothermia bacterium]